MELRDYLESLSAAELEAYAARLETSAKYLRTHVTGPTRGASLKFMRALARESNGNVGLANVLMHYGVTEEELNNKAA
ncbi:MAG TPA: hypothetical protein DDZ35_02555 [Halomonas sp.]|nr:hypothetical protein [Halomonas sp.]